MRTSHIILLLSFFILMQPACKEAPKESATGQLAQVEKNQYTEEYRPQFHFSPSEKWMNDPNGLVYYNGIYHLFYQYYPEDIIWGPMHWGHAVSRDMVYWEHKPIALYPDEHGYIFSGSAVMDVNNTSGLGTEDKPPLVAIFTYHDMKGENAGRNDFQTQGIAYSIDNGETWEKYSGNPVIPNSGIRDFRDPKVFWHEESQNWILVLVAGDHAQFYRSGDLKQWEFMSEFGKDAGAHGGVWECPDLFPLKVDGSGQDKWVLIVSINPGAPNGGSGTQYFVGDFNGTTFTSDHDDIRWLDWGTDNYAGITYNDVPGGDRIFIGWMSNWLYARDTPTEKWRSAMTVPRKLTLRNAGGKMILFNYPLDIMGTILRSEIQEDFSLVARGTETVSFDHINQSEVRFKTTARDFVLTLKNAMDEELVLIMNGEQEKFLLDRTASGKTDFHEQFGDRIQQMPIADLPEESFEVRLLLDWSSIEIFINEGQYVMTSQLFPNEPYNELQIENLTDAEIEFLGFEVSKAESIW